MNRLRSKLTYANVVATLALFLVLAGGTAFAAKQMLPKNSVGTKQIKKNAITGAKIKNGAITGSKLSLSTVGTVPSAATANTANTANTATTATNATELGGLDPSRYQGRIMWANVGPDGTILSQSGGITEESPFPGGYYLHFPHTLASQAIVATLKWEPTAIGTGFIRVLECGGPFTPTECEFGSDTSSDAYVETEEEEGFFVEVTPDTGARRSSGCRALTPPPSGGSSSKSKSRGARFAPWPITL
jgi:hypothetical protein